MSLAHNNQKTKSVSNSNLNLEAEFNNYTVSQNCFYTYIEDFKKSLEFKKLLQETISYKKAPNSKYTTHEIVEYLIDAIIQGYFRFSHMDDFRDDPGVKKTKETDLPSEKTCRELLKQLPEETIHELRELNRKLLASLAENEPAREVIINFDDTVCTVFGNQQDSGNGYNPRYNGRASYKEKIAMIAYTNELLATTLENGKHHSNHNFLEEFISQMKDALPDNWFIKRLRGDAGLFDQENFHYLEEHCIEYLIKARKVSSIQKIIDYVNNNQDQFPWRAIDETHSVTEIRVALPAWEKDRRIVLVRKSLPKIETNGQLIINLDEFKYQYQAIITNIDYLTPEEIFHDYNQRCDVENKIDELKEGFAFDQNSQLNKKCNELFLLLKTIAYNLHNWFKRQILPEEMQHHEMSTIRRKLYKVVGNIVGNGRYRHIKFPPCSWLKKVILHVRAALKRFRKQVAFP